METPDAARTMAYLRRLEAASRWLRVTTFGRTPQGRDLPLVILSKRRAFTPAEAAAAGDPVVLIQSGIHAGEIDGKDASLQLLRDIAVTKSLARIADGVTVLFLPIFNLDGHERRGPWNRINQNGPAETGWRTTAQNLNLNRDYLKADAPEMRAWLRVFSDWNPDFLVDCHVTDGIDFRYNLTYSMEMYANAPPEIVALQRAFERALVDSMAARGDPVFPYVVPREDADLSKGLICYASPPRFSTGYAAIRNRPALLIETHMLKPYATRVASTFRVLEQVLAFARGHRAELRAAARAADARTVAEGAAPRDTAWYPLQFASTRQSRMVEFLGYASDTVHSDISGGTVIAWHRDRPRTLRIPYFDDVRPSLLVRPPRCYLLPREWTAEIDVLRAHGVHLFRLREETTLPVETTIFSAPRWRQRPFEGRHPLESVRHTTRRDTIAWPAGTVVVPLDQPAAHVAIHLLEPDGPDSFVSWGFFDAVFEQKEYAEQYVLEALASRMLAADPRLRKEFADSLAADSAFARSPYARLDFFYRRSPYFDDRMDVYPVARCFTLPDPRILEALTAVEPSRRAAHRRR